MKSAKNVKIKKNSITIKRLKKGKTYYVRVRAFSKDSNGKQICTAWSTAKKVTIKKEGVKILVSMESKSF